MLNEILAIFPPNLKKTVEFYVTNHSHVLEEIRVRIGRPVEFTINNQPYFESYLPSAEDALFILNKLSQFSIYMIEEELKKGYVTIEGGHRVGLAGKVVTENGQVRVIRDVSSFNIRIAKQKIGISNQLIPFLYNRYWQNLYFLAHKRLKSAMAAEEIVQNVFLTIWNRRKTLEIEDLPPYLATATRYAVYHYLAAEKKRVKSEAAAGKRLLKVIPGELLIDDKQLLEQVKRLASELPEKCRLVFIYNKIDDQALPEVAQTLNISVKTAEAHLTKALRLIRSRMKDHALFIFINL